jgi:hypothetical protein
MNTSIKACSTEDMRHRTARDAAVQIVGALEQFIPYACRREAHDRISELFYKHNIEITTLAQREQYEAMRKVTLEASYLQGLVPEAK